MGFFGSRKKVDVGALLVEKDCDGLSDLIRTNRDFTIRKKAIQALGKINTPEAADALTKVLELGDGLLRVDATVLLGDFSDEKATSALIVALQDPDPMVRESAAKSLGKIGSSVASQYLTSLLSDNKLFVRKAATAAIESIRKKVQEELDKIAPQDDTAESGSEGGGKTTKKTKRRKSTPSGGPRAGGGGATPKGEKPASDEGKEGEEGEEKPKTVTQDGMEFLPEDEENEKAIDFSKYPILFPEEGVSDTHKEDMLTMTIVAAMDQRNIEIDIVETLDEEYPCIQYGTMSGRQRTRIFDELIRTKSMKLYRLDEMHSKVVSERKLNDVGENVDKTYFIYAILPKIPPDGYDIDIIRKRLKRRMEKVKVEFFPKKSGK